MSDNKFGFTVDDIIAEFDKKKADPSASYNIIKDYEEEFSEELSPSGEYIPRHAKPAPPEETAEQTENTPDSSETPLSESTSEADTKQESVSEAASSEETVPNEASAKPNAAEQDKSDEPMAAIEPKVSDEPKATAEPKASDEPTASLPNTDLPESDNSAGQEITDLDEPVNTSPTESEVPETIENTENDITESNIIDDISEEETNKPSEPEAPPQPTAVLDGVIPAESFSDKSTDESGAFSSVFANGLDDTDKAENEPQETVEILNADIPDWGDILPEPSIEETVDDAITDYESEDIEEDETVPEDIDETDDTVDDISDDEIIDNEPESDEANPEKEDTPTEKENSPDSQKSNSAESVSKNETVQTDDIPPFEPEPITLTAEEAAEDNAKKAKKNILKELLPWKGDTVFEMIRKIVFIIAVIIFIGAGVMLASTLIQSDRAVKDLEQIKEVVTTTAKTTIDSEGKVITVAPTEEEEQQHNIDIMSYYKGISDKVVGFIELEGCDIYQPVVQDPEDTTNTYYLTHTYYDEKNKGGAIFMDYRCTVSEDYVSPNLVLYGHNQEDGTMFGNLKNYKQNLEFYADNPTVTLRTEYETGTYLIYAFFVTNALEKHDSNGEVFHYHDYIEALNDEATFDWYMGEVQSRNQIISPVKAEFGDKLLLLSTCSNEFSDSRFVVFARKLRDGESVSDYDFTSASFNPYARGVDWIAIMSGETTTTTSETTVPEETDEEDGETTTKKKKKKKTSASDEESSADTLNADVSDTDTPVDADVTTVPPDASDDESGEDTTTKKKKKKTTTEATEETSAEETTSKKKKSTSADTSEETTAEETTKKKSKKTTTETTAEETTSKKKKSTTKETTAETSEAENTEESTVTSVPETESEETTTVTAN